MNREVHVRFWESPEVKVEVQRRAIETAQLEARLRAVEERVGTDEQRA